MKRSLKRKQRREQALASEEQHQQQQQQQEPELLQKRSENSLETTQEHSSVSEETVELKQPSSQTEETVEVKQASPRVPPLLNKPVDLTCMSKILGVKLQDYYSAGNTPAINAAVENDMGKFMELVPTADINIPNYRGFTALHALAEKGNAVIIRTLGMKYLAPSLNAQTHDEGSTPLIAAVISGHADACHALANTLGADIFLPDNHGFSAFMHALNIMSSTKKDIVVKILLESIQDGYYQYTSALNTLGFAAASGMVELTEFLMDTYGLDVNVPLQRLPHGDHMTPLMLAAESNQLGVVRLLTLKYGAVTNLVNLAGDTALIIATMTKSLDVVRYLSGLKGTLYVDLMMRNSWNQTAYSLALGMQHAELAQILEHALKEKERQYVKAKNKAQKRKAYQKRKQSRERMNEDSIKAYHPCAPDITCDPRPDTKTS